MVGGRQLWLCAYQNFGIKTLSLYPFFFNFCVEITTKMSALESFISLFLLSNEKIKYKFQSVFGQTTLCMVVPTTEF